MDPSKYNKGDIVYYQGYQAVVKAVWRTARRYRYEIEIGRGRISGLWTTFERYLKPSKK